MSAGAKWQKIWSKRYSLRLGENWVFSVRTRFAEIFGVPFPAQRIIIEGGIGRGYVDTAEHRRALDGIRERILSEGFSAYFESRAVPVFDAFLAGAKRLSAADLGNLSGQGLAAALSNFESEEDEWMNYVWMVFLLDECLSGELDAAVGARFGEGREGALRAILTPERPSAVARQRLDFLSLAARHAAGEPVDFDSEIAALAARYAYFSVLNMDEDPVSAGAARSRYEEVVAAVGGPNRAAATLALEEAARREADARFGEIVSAAPDARFANLVTAARKVAFYREHRNDLRQESYFHARALYAELARRAGRSVGDAVYSTRAERCAAALGGALPDSAALAERRLACAIESGAAEVHYEFDTSAVGRWGDECDVRATAPSPEGELRGTVAYPGLVRGRARIVRDLTKDAASFADGDILVATTTNLAFVPLMGRAAAVVTDEGGMLTHTAIVCRELKKPAIVGTRHATSSIPEGSTIEVDANLGFVRRI